MENDLKNHPEHPNSELLRSATVGFDYLFSNDIVSARAHFERRDDPFHLMGLGVCAFLEAALGMETGLMSEATRCLSLSEAGTRKQTRVPKPRDMTYQSRFHYGLEWEILNADAVVLLGLTHALSESYMGYLQCMYSLNNAHSKFTKLYKTVFPNGLPHNPTFSVGGPPSPTTPNVSVSPSLPINLHHKPSVESFSSQTSTSSTNTISTPVPASAVKSSFFSRWVGTPSTQSLPITPPVQVAPDGPVEDLIVAGTAFGFGLFNLVFSLLPKKIQGLVGFFGFKHDRKLALQALSLAASKQDVHGVFAGLVLMTYLGVVLLLSGYQANEHKILAEYKTIVDKIESRYPDGALWVLNRAKIMRMSYDPEGSIKVLQQGLNPNRKHSFVQADMLLIFELAWTLLGQRRYREASEAFIRITKLNSWSHATYYFIAAGCELAIGNKDHAQSMLDAIPDLIDKRKISGKDLPTEVFIKKKLAFYKEKQARRGGDEKHYIESVAINPAEEIGIFWNNHARIGAPIAQGHIDVLNALTPPVNTNKIRLEASTPGTGTHSLHSHTKSPHAHSPLPPSSPVPRTPSSRTPIPPSPTSPLPNSPSPKPTENDLDTPDELAIRALMLGVNYRTLKEFEIARGFLNESYAHQSEVKVSTWVGGIAAFELAVLDLKEAEERERRHSVSSDVNGTMNGDAVPAQHGPAHRLAEKVHHLHLNLHDKDKGDGASSLKDMWVDALKSASAKLDNALGLATSSVDLSSRLDSRIAMLKDEIASKKEMLGVTF